MFRLVARMNDGQELEIQSRDGHVGRQLQLLLVTLKLHSKYDEVSLLVEGAGFISKKYTKR